MYRKVDAIQSLLRQARHLSGKPYEVKIGWYEYFKRELSHVLGWSAGRHSSQEVYEETIRKIVEALKV